MKTAPKITDIARLAGVSTATVDRVLNRRPGVRQATIQRVLKVATRLEYLSPTDVYTDLRPRPMRLTFLLPKGTNRVIHMFVDAIAYSQNQLAPFNVKCRCEMVDEFNPEAMAESLLNLRGRADGVVFMALEHPLVREAVKTLAAEGIPAVTLISDLPASERCAYVGLDNIATGRTAGYLLGRLTSPNPGKFALIAGSLSYRAHRDREFGFMQIMEEMRLAHQVIGIREGRDDSQTNYGLTRALLEQHPDLSGIYNIGGASDGVGKALKHAGRNQQVVFIGHGLTSDIRALLIDGTLDAVIMQDPQTAIMSCVRILAGLRDGSETPDSAARIKPVNSIILFRENLP
ncbi:LacI family DNA-binding transcriptional regulator [Paracandidimonas soli]|uniref:LacI family DNA-binding transcriptional regulator n=1 Tax=Paracandidimonas soli TaxID=1917182 RepID=UPI0033402C1A